MFRRLTILGLAFIAISALSADSQPPKIDSAKEAVRLLGHRRFAVRETAMRWLWEAGDEAVPLLQTARQSSDRETRMRAEVLLERLSLGIRPNTPAEVVAAIMEYRQGSPREKAETLKTLLKKGQPQVAVRLIQFSLDHGEEWLEDQIELVLPHLVLTRQLELAESLLQRNAQLGREGALYRSFLLTTGRIDHAIAEFERKTQQNSDVLQLQQLALLHRARGDLTPAITVARKAAEQDHNLLELLLTEAGQFAELSQRLELRLDLSKPPDRDELPRYGFLLAFYDAAGKTEAADRLAKLLSQWKDEVPRSSPTISRLLLANGRFDAGMKLIAEDDPLGHFNLLRHFERWDDALKWLGIRDFADPALEKWFAARLAKAGKGRRQSPDEFEEVTTVCRMLSRLGEKKLAAKYLDRLIESLRGLPNHFWTAEVAGIVEIELQLGMREQAVRHASEVFGKGSVKSVTAMLYPDRAAEAVFWWNVFRGPVVQDPFGEATVPFSRTLDKLRTLLDGRMSQNEIKQLIKETIEQKTKGKPEEIYKALPSLANTLRRYRLLDEAVKLLDDLDTTDRYQLLEGDLLAESERWHDAAEAYSAAVGDHPDLTLARFLEAFCWEQSGEKELAKQRFELANQLVFEPLDRVSIADQLIARHWNEQAVEQLELVIRSIDPNGENDAIYGYTLRKLCQPELADHVATTSLLKAWRWSLWRTMEPELFLSNVGFYPYFVFEARFHHAKFLLESGQVDEALVALAAAHKASPSGIEVAEYFVPELVKLGRNNEADRLFKKVDSIMTQLCQRFPDSALYLNNLAWMYARCDRKLDKGLELAEHAVKLEPDNATYLDTLAEVEFRRGNRRRALELAKRCVVLDPDHPHYRRQVARFSKPASNGNS